MALLAAQTDDHLSKDIITAVGHLTHLATRIRGSQFKFRTHDVENIDQVIDAINELEMHRAVVHDQLEAETIKCSILRHELKVLPEIYRNQIHDAVVNARESNKALVARLNEQLKEADRTIEYLTAKQEELEMTNTDLLPERDKLRETHEEVISVLNVRMAEKAAKQIQLNETRDRLRATNQKILDFEDDLLNLKEDMIKERSEYRGEKAQLQAKIRETRALTVKQNEANYEAKAELDFRTRTLTGVEKDLDMLRNLNNQSESNIAKSEGQQKGLSNQVNKQMRDNDTLRKNILDVQRKEMDVKHKYERDIENMQKSNEKLKSSIKVKEERRNKLQGRVDDLKYESGIVSERKNESQKQVGEVNTVLNEAKSALIHKQEDVARLRAENDRMEEEIVELGDSHKICVENFNRQIEEYRDQLSKERKERMEVQSKRDNVQKNLDDFKQSNNRYMASINKKVTQGKQRHEDLTNEGQDLQREIKKLDEAIKVAKVEARTEKLEYETKKAELQERLATLQNEIVQFEQLTSKAQELMDIKVPEFEKQKLEFAEIQSHYEKVKKEVTGMKSQKASLDDQVKRTRVAIEKHTKPQSDIRRDIVILRDKMLAALKHQSAETEELEREMYVVGTKMQTISDENHRFVVGNETFESDIKTLQEESVTCADDIEHLKAEYALLKALLYDAWADDNKLEKEFADRDMDILEKLADVLEISFKRTRIVTKVNENLDGELEGLAKFLDDISGRRPKVEVTDTSMNTKGQRLTHKSAQPSQRFLDRQARLDEMGIILPDDTGSVMSLALSTPASPNVERMQKSSRIVEERESKMITQRSHKGSLNAHSKNPLPPINRTKKSIVTADTSQPSRKLLPVSSKAKPADSGTSTNVSSD